ncbi:ubiquitin carboxyl-terminal hydrolase 12-like isoform X2 [Papaver somniferum]|uniref:ubiquitin carboxyl-terminal hydrolase 12-like isoform X2 n=1 Tax=Papaver somniferum TaxID=3469 RepID=UPI000E6FE3CC|nr:ubiquitin carboxyl-terminal hydrolase 12-like isoform X2 [Papaver somniferum]
MYKVITFDNVTERVTRHLGLDDPTKIKLTLHRCCSQQPIAPAIKYHGFDHLSEMLIHHNQKSDILYFEVLDIPPPLLEGLKTLNVSFHHEKKDTVIHRISLPSKSTVSRHSRGGEELGYSGLLGLCLSLHRRCI